MLHTDSFFYFLALLWPSSAAVRDGDAASGRLMVQEFQFVAFEMFAPWAMAPSPTSMVPITNCGVPEVMSISLTMPALATAEVTFEPSRALALTVSLYVPS